MNLKYAHIERERRFIVPGISPVFAFTRELLIKDNYLNDTTLRLRRVEESGMPTVYKFGQKLRLVENSPSVLAHTTMYVTRDEYEALSTLPNRILEKTRRLFPVGGLVFGIDDFHGPLTGLKIFEVDLGADGSLPDLIDIELGAEVTDDERFTGGALASTTHEVLNQMLVEYGVD